MNQDNDKVTQQSVEGTATPSRSQPLTQPRADEREVRGRDGSSRRRPRRRGWVWVLILLFALATIYFVHRFSGGSDAGKNAPAGAGGRAQTGPAAITTGQSKTGDISIYVTALGTVTPANTITVYSQVTGRVIEVHYREGQMVLKGDPLLDIDPRPYQATLDQAEGTLAHDQGLLAEARIDLKRYAEANARNAIARQQLEDQEQTVVQYEGTVKADQGTVSYDKVQLEYCHIVAPITGRVGLRLVDPGNTVFAGSASTLVVITELQPITVVFDVSEDDLPRVQSQLRGGRVLNVDVFDRANETKIESGKLTSLDNQVDTTTGTVKFRATFQNRTLSLFPNQFVNARLLVNTLHNVTLVPTPAVQYNGTSPFVYIVNANKTVSVQQITTQTGNEQVTAVQGLNAGVILATSGFDRLENGAQVLVREPRAGQPNSPGPSAPGSPGGPTGSKTP